MKLLMLLAADYANIAEGGKLNVMGIFRNINAPKFPVRLSSIYLVVKLQGELGEYGQKRKSTIILQDEFGNRIIESVGEIEIPNTQHGLSPEVNIILNLRDIVFPKAGPYQFIILVDKDHKGDLQLDVVDISIKLG